MSREGELTAKTKRTLLILCRLAAPAVGSFGYEAYNFLVTTLLKGPFGAISAILLFLVTILLFVQQKIVPAVVCLIAAIVLINAADMVTALGAIY